MEFKEGKGKKTIVKALGWYADPMTFLENMGKNGAANWGYEYHTVGRPTKFPIDIDLSVTVIDAEALAKAEDLGHSTICQFVQELRAGITRLLGIDQLEIWVWNGSRFKKADDDKTKLDGTPNYKISYHVGVVNLHAEMKVGDKKMVCIGYFAHLIRNIFPNGFLVEGTDIIDMTIYAEGRQLRVPGGAKHGAENEPEVPFGLITRNPYGPDDDLSREVLPDIDFKAAMRSLITVVDPDNSTLLDTEKLNMGLLIKTTKPNPGKQKGTGKKQTSSNLPSAGPATPHQTAARPPPPGHDTAIDTEGVKKVASVLVSVHPEIGSEYPEFFRQLMIIHREVGCHPDVVSIVVERARISRIRGRVTGASAVEKYFCGLKPRGSGIVVTMGTLRGWAEDRPALVFKETENSTGLGAVEGTSAAKLDLMLRRVDTEEVAWRFLVQCVSYLAHHAELQTRAWIQQHYPQVNDEEFKTAWCFQRQSEYYEQALETYIEKELDNIDTPRVKRARTGGSSGKGEAANTLKPAAWQAPKAAASHIGKGDGPGGGTGVGGKRPRDLSENRFVRAQPLKT
jgi:hypothetical protein